MCVRIRQFPSALCVFSAGTQYFFKENSARGNTGIQWKNMLKYCKKKMLKIAGSVDKSGKQVVKTPRVLTPRCWKQRVLRWSFSEKFDTTNQNHYFFMLCLQAEVIVFTTYVLWIFTRVQCWNTDFCNLHVSAKYVNLHANYQVPHFTSMFSRGKIEIYT